MNIEQSVCQMGVENANTRTVHKFLKNFLNDIPMRPSKNLFHNDTIRYDTIGEFNVDWKAQYSALSSTRSQKKN